MEDAGISAVVLPSLFEEQLQLESLSLDSDLSRGDESFAEVPHYFPDLQTYNLGPEGYLELIHRSQEKSEDSSHRELERRHPRAAGSATPG